MSAATAGRSRSRAASRGVMAVAQPAQRVCLGATNDRERSTLRWIGWTTGDVDDGDRERTLKKMSTDGLRNCAGTSILAMTSSHDSPGHPGAPRDPVWPPQIMNFLRRRLLLPIHWGTCSPSSCYDIAWRPRCWLWRRCCCSRCARSARRPRSANELESRVPREVLKLSAS